MALTQEQKDFYCENGYLAYEQVLTSEELDLLRVEYDFEFQKAQETNAFRNLARDDGGDAEAKRDAPLQMYQIINMHERNLHFRRHLYNDRILAVVEDLIGPNIMLFHDQALYKPAHRGGPVFWHQDNAYWKCSPANLVSCWLALDDTFRENGAMQVIPGSHLKPVEHGTSAQTTALKETLVDDSVATVIEIKAGSCMFHHCQTLHHTPPNCTEHPRRAMVTHYMIPGTRGASGEILRVSLANPILRMSIM